MDRLGNDYVQRSQINVIHHSCLNIILSSKHVINLSEIIGIRRERLDAARGLEVLCQMSMLTEDTHLGSKLAKRHANMPHRKPYLIVRLGLKYVS